MAYECIIIRPIHHHSLPSHIAEQPLIIANTILRTSDKRTRNSFAASRAIFSIQIKTTDNTFNIQRIMIPIFFNISIVPPRGSV